MKLTRTVFSLADHLQSAFTWKKLTKKWQSLNLVIQPTVILVEIFFELVNSFYSGKANFIKTW